MDSEPWVKVGPAAGRAMEGEAKGVVAKAVAAAATEKAVGKGVAAAAMAGEGAATARVGLAAMATGAGGLARVVMGAGAAAAA